MQGSEGSGNHRTPPLVYAGLVTRVIAIVLDTLVINVVALAVSGAVLLVLSVFSIDGSHHSAVAAIGSIAFVAWVIGYFGFFWTTTGQTPGSQVMQIRVTRVDGNRVRKGRAMIRLLWMSLSLPLFWGYWPILVNARRRGVFDAFAGTVVTYVPPVVTPAGPHGRPIHPSGIDPPTTVPSPGTE
jgi:uncharacterized RDD family membrane protein YckC